MLHAAVSIPNVVCLHLLSDLTPTACPTDSMLRLVNLLPTQSSCQFGHPSACSGSNCCTSSVFPTFVTVHQLALNRVSVPTSVIPICVPIFMTTRHLVLNPTFNFVTIRHLVLSPRLCWIGLFLSQLRRWQLSCRLLPWKISSQICAPVTRPPVLRQSSCQRVFLTGLCFLFVFVPLREILSSKSPRVVCLLFAFALAWLAFGFVARARPSTRLICMYSVFFRQYLTICP